MLGSPILRLLVAIVLFVAAGIGTWVVTSYSSQPPAPEPATEIEKEIHPIEMSIQVESPVSPLRFRVRLGEATLIELQSPGAAFHSDMVIPKGSGLDLLLEAEWEEATQPVAIKVQVSQDEKVVGEGTFWGKGTIRDVIHLSENAVNP